MKKKHNRKRMDKGFSLLLSIILVFAFLGTIIFQWRGKYLRKCQHRQSRI